MQVGVAHLEFDGIYRDGTVVHHTDIFADSDAVRAGICDISGITAIKYVFFITARIVAAVGDITLYDRRRIHDAGYFRCEIRHHVFYERNDVLYAKFRIFSMIHIPESICLGVFETCLRVGVICPYIRIVSFLICDITMQQGDSGICRILRAVDPVLDLIICTRIAMRCLIGHCSILDDLEFIDQRFRIRDRARSSFYFLQERIQLRCQFYRFLQRCNTRIHVLVDHMLAQLTQRVRSRALFAIQVIYIRESVIPYFVGFLLALPHVPCELRITEDRNLGRLGLLHRVQHDALISARLDIRVQEGRIAAHDQVVLAVVGARPVRPHVRRTSYLLSEVCTIVAGNLAPDLSAGRHDLDVFRQHGILGQGRRSGIILRRAVQQVCLQPFVLCLLAFQPFAQIGEQAIGVFHRHAGCVIGEHAELTDTRIQQLLELRFDHGQVVLIVVKVERAVHERVDGPHIAALRLVSDSCQLSDLGQFFFRVQRAPLTVVIRIILRREDVLVHLEFPAELHQFRTVFIGPRVSIVSFDESAECDV